MSPIRAASAASSRSAAAALQALEESGEVRGAPVDDGLEDVRAATDEVVVLDYGGQYSQLIARRVRECGVFSELLPHHVGAAEVARRRPKGVILSGGPASVYADGAPPLEPALLELGVPVLGICYGMQLIALGLGGKRRGGRGRRVWPLGSWPWPSRTAAGRHPGRADLLDVTPRHRVLRRRRASRRWPPRPHRRWRRLSRMERSIYGIQFHPEVVHTPYGQQVLTNFLADVCGCDRGWSAASVIEDQIERIRAQVGEHGRAICGLSGRR